MALTVKRGYSNDPYNKIDRAVTSVTAATADIKEPTDVVNPTLVFSVPANAKSDLYTKTNEIYIDAFKRWYTVDGITFPAAGLVEYRCACDVLKTYASDIKANSLFIARQEYNYNPLIFDDMRQRENDYTTPYNAAYAPPFTPDDFCYVCQIIGGNPGITGGVATVILNQLAFTSLVSNFFSLTSAFFNPNPANNVLQCVKLPINAATLAGLCGGSAVTSVLVGKETISLVVGAYSAPNSTAILYDNQISFPSKYTGDDWRNFESMFSIYVPYCGKTTMNGTEIENKLTTSNEIRCRITLDIISGDLQTAFYNREGNPLAGYTELVRWTMQGNCAIITPVSGANYSSMLTGATSLITAGVGVATENPALIAGGLTGLASSVRDISYSGGVTRGAPSWEQPQKITVCRTDREYIGSAEYAHEKGLPLREKVSANTLSGFTQCENVQLTFSGSPAPTDGEKMEIKNLLESGVIF